MDELEDEIPLLSLTSSTSVVGLHLNFNFHYTATSNYTYQCHLLLSSNLGWR